MVRFLDTFIVMMLALGICVTSSAEKLTAQPSNGALILNLNNVNNGPMFLNLFKQGGCTTPTPLNLTRMVIRWDGSLAQSPAAG